MRKQRQAFFNLYGFNEGSNPQEICLWKPDGLQEQALVCGSLAKVSPNRSKAVKLHAKKKFAQLLLHSYTECVQEVKVQLRPGHRLRL